jgi:Ala-tRNA(Pro) deacylase
MLVVVPANRRVDLEKVEQITEHTVSLDTESEFRSFFPDCQVGTMPPFGKPVRFANVCRPQSD